MKAAPVAAAAAAAAAQFNFLNQGCSDSVRPDLCHEISSKVVCQEAINHEAPAVRIAYCLKLFSGRESPTSPENRDDCRIRGRVAARAGRNWKLIVVKQN